MILALEIVMLIGGIYALIAGKLKLSKTMDLLGSRARIAGIIMILPLPLAFGFGLVIGLLIGMGILPSSLQSWSWCIEVIIVIACIAGVYGYASASKPPQDSLPPSDEPPAISQP
jgi:MFS family permease